MSRKISSIILIALFCTVFVALTTLQNEQVAAAPLTQANSPLPTPPANDNFAQAQVIPSLPFEHQLDIRYATIEPQEPFPSCGYGTTFNQTIWYSYTPTTAQVLLVGNVGYPTFLAVYTRTNLGSLQSVLCTNNYWSDVVLEAQAGVTYYIQIGTTESYAEIAYARLQLAPPPEVNLYYNVYEPSTYDQIQFYGNVYDPAYRQIAGWHWDFGDGKTSTDPNPSHQYKKDGDYVVQLTVSTADGRAGSSAQTIAVRTHDVAITRFARPKAVTVGQTKRLVISVTNSRYPEEVQVDLYKSIPGGYSYIGFLRQFVDAKPKGKTTNFYLSYTFTKEDAQLGKVILKAVAYPINARDAFPADNEFITFAIKVKAKKAGSANSADEAVTSAALDDMSDYVTDDVSNVEETLETADDAAGSETNSDDTVTNEDTGGAQNFISYLPLISDQ